MKKIIISFVTLILLNGCSCIESIKTIKTDENNISLAKKIIIVKAQQNELWVNNVINNKKLSELEPIYYNTQLISIDWNGDGVELLQQLARQYDFKFYYVGIRLPIPISIKVKNIPFESLFTLIESQISWRAKLTIEENKKELFLNFNENVRLNKFKKTKLQSKSI